LPEPSSLEKLPTTQQELIEYFGAVGEANPYPLRRETLLRIATLTGRPVICYVTKTNNLPQDVAVATYIEDGDLAPFGDLIHSTSERNVDVVLVSNGGLAETAERIVRLLRGSFETIRFIIPANAYSAATLMCFAGDEIIIDLGGTLGPIDPQYRGIPARTILRSFEKIEERLQAEGPRALAAYMPLIEKYDLHLLEMCRSAEELSRELAQRFLSNYMFKGDEKSEQIAEIVEFFSDYDSHKSHARGVDRDKSRELGLKVTNAEDIEGLSGLLRSLYNQYEFLFDRTIFYKIFENADGFSWAKQDPSVTRNVAVVDQ
jgi:hypothetical protein